MIQQTIPGVRRLDKKQAKRLTRKAVDLDAEVKELERASWKLHRRIHLLREEILELKDTAKRLREGKGEDDGSQGKA